MNELENSTRINIHNELKNVTSANSPYLFASIQTVEGYMEIEKRIIEIATRESMPIQAVLPLLEMELSGS